jgi:hypothetical protein
LSTDFDIRDDAVVDCEKYFDLVATQRVMAFTAHSRWLERPAVAWVLVMIENDLAI